MSLLSRSADAERVDDATHVLTGGRGAGSVRAVAYAAYVAALIGASYGFTVVQAVLRTTDPAWLRGQLASPVFAVLVVGLGVLGILLVHRAARIRGAVVPPTPWTDLVVSSPNDRAVTLRRWWLISLSGAVIGGALTGAILGGAAWYAGLGGALTLTAAVLGGGAYGSAIALAWLAGQSGVSTGRLWAPPTTALRGMRVDDLRAQAARSAMLGGSILSGDLRAARFELTAPVTRLRRTRLRHRGPWATVVARDVLGLRRAPGGAVLGALTLVVAGAGLGWAVGSAAAPALAGLVAGLLAHAGASAFGEGMRQQADNLTAPALLGLGRRTEAVGHAVPVAVTTALLAGGPLTAVALSSGADLGAIAVTVVVVTVALVGSVATASFRGPMPRSPFAGSGVPTSLIGWQAFPALLAATTAAVTTRGLAGHDAGAALVAAVPGVFAAVGLVVLADILAGRLARSHRDA